MTLPGPHARASVASWFGLARYADAYRLSRSIFLIRDVRNIGKRLLIQSRQGAARSVPRHLSVGRRLGRGDGVIAGAPLTLGTPARRERCSRPVAGVMTSHRGNLLAGAQSWLQISSASILKPPLTSANLPRS
jgi:hypothetical protein